MAARKFTRDTIYGGPRPSDVMTSGDFTASSDKDRGAIDFRVRVAFPIEWTSIGQVQGPAPFPLPLPDTTSITHRVPLFATPDDEITISLRAGWVAASIKERTGQPTIWIEQGDLCVTGLWVTV